MLKRGDKLNYGLLAEIDLWSILIVAGIAVTLLIWAKIDAKELDRTLTKEARPDVTGLQKRLNHLSTVYTVLLALISIFPLLGMLGTVLALLDLDITNASEALQNDFFAALNTTAVGLVCSIIFKILTSLFQAEIEMQEERASQYLEKRYF